MPKAFHASDWLCGLFGFALMTAYWPGISGAVSTPRWGVAALLAVALFFAPRVRMTAAHWIGLALLGWMGLTLCWNDGGHDGVLDGIDVASELVIVAIAFAVGSTLQDVRPLIVGAAVGIGVNSAFAFAQWFGWHSFVETRDGSFAGLFYERDRFAAAAAMVAIGLVSIPRLRRLLPLVAPALILAPSRAAWLAVGAGLLPMEFIPVRLRKALGIILIGVPLVYLVVHGAGPSDNERLMIWHDTIGNLNVFGHGLGSFREDFVRFADAFNIAIQRSRPEHPHNEWLWLMFEGGVPGLCLGLLLAVAVWCAAVDRAERGVLTCLFTLSLFAMPLHDPATVILGAVVAGYLAGRDAMLRIIVGDCRSALCPWLAAHVYPDEPLRTRCGATGLSVPAAVSRGTGEASADLRGTGDLSNVQ